MPFSAPLGSVCRWRFSRVPMAVLDVKSPVQHNLKVRSDHDAPFSRYFHFCSALRICNVRCHPSTDPMIITYKGNVQCIIASAFVTFFMLVGKPFTTTVVNKMLSEHVPYKRGVVRPKWRSQKLLDMHQNMAVTMTMKKQPKSRILELVLAQNSCYTVDLHESRHSSTREYLWQLF